jgi:sugar diacid utilization regulator
VEPDLIGHRSETTPRPRLGAGAPVGSIIELFKEHTAAVLLPELKPGMTERRANGVTFATGGPLGEEAAGAVVIVMEGASHLVEDLQRSATAAGAALLLLGGGLRPGPSADGGPLEGLEPSAASIATVWLHRHADLAEVVALCRAATAGGVAETTVGIPLGDIFALVNSMAALAGGAVSIADTVGRILGYSTLPNQQIDEMRRKTTLKLHEEVSPQKDTDFADLYANGRAVIFPKRSAANFPRAGIAVRSAGEILGTIWVILEPDTRKDTVIDILESMEPIVAQHLMSVRLFGRREIERTTDLVRSVINDPENAVAAARLLGLGMRRRRVLARFRFLDSRLGATIRDLHRLHHTIETHARISFPHSVAALIDTDVVVIIELEERQSLEEAAAFSRRIATYQQQSGNVLMIVGVSDVAADLAGLRTANLQALDTLVAMERTRRTETQREEKIRSPDSSTVVGLFSNWRALIGVSHVVEALRHTHIWPDDRTQRILAYDAEHDTAFAETLLAFFRSRENVSDTATKLHTHHNTIRYRLSRTEQLFDLDMNDPQQRLWLWLRLEAEKLS